MRSKFVNYLLKIVSIALLVIASFFIIIQIFEYFSPPKTNPASVINPIELIDNDTLLSLLSVIIVFAGLLSFIFRELIRSDLEASIQAQARELSDAERRASRAENHLASSYVFSLLYDADDKKFSKFLHYAIKYNDKALQDCANLNMENYGDIVLRAKNYLAYDLARQQSEQKAVDLLSKTRALRLRNEIWEMIVAR